MTEETQTKSAVEATRDMIADLYKPQIVETRSENCEFPAKFLVHGRELTAHPLTQDIFEKEEAAPFSRRGTATLLTVESFIDHAVRFADEDSVIFANPDPLKPSLTAVLDYHRQGSTGQPRWGRHRSAFAFPLSREWKAWAGGDRKTMGMVEFARFVEDRVLDVTNVAPEELRGLDEDKQMFIKATGGLLASRETLLKLSVSLKVNESTKVREARNLTTGEAQVSFESGHETEIAGDVVKFPSAFIVTVPVFKGSTEAFRLLARLRYRKDGAALVFWFELWRQEETFEVAFNEACARVLEKTGLPVIFGSPE